MTVFFLIQFLLVLAAAPLTVGLLRMLKARFQNRRGASPTQPYWALLSLSRKEMTVPRNSSWVFHAVPVVVLATSLTAAFIVPTMTAFPYPASLANVFVLAGVLALGSVFLVFGGMDTGSAFSNMGSSREMAIAALVEAPLYMVLTALGFLSGSWDLGGILNHFASTPWSAVVPLASVTLVALLFVVLAENARYPVDNPATHLELTMVHEAMLLEYSGPYLAMLEYASAIKLTALMMFFLSLVAPFGLITGATPGSGIALSLAVFAVKLAIAAFIVAFIESTLVKMRFYRMQEYMTLAFILAVFGLAVVFITHASASL